MPRIKDERVIRIEATAIGFAACIAWVIIGLCDLLTYVVAVATALLALIVRGFVRFVRRFPGLTALLGSVGALVLVTWLLFAGHLGKFSKFSEAAAILAVAVSVTWLLQPRNTRDPGVEFAPLN